LVDANKAPGFQQRPLSSDPISDAANIESQIEVVRSDGVALAVISHLKLADDPSFLPKPSLPSQVWNWMTSRFISQAPQTDLDPKVYGALELYRKSLTVRRLNLSFALEVSFTALSPSKAAQIANAIADVFIEQGLQEKVRTAQSAGDWLNKRLAELEQNALSAERAVQEFKTQHGMVDTGRSGDGNAQFIDQKRVEELSTQLTVARAQTADAEAKLRRIEEVTGAASGAYRNDLLLAKSREEELSKRLNEAIRAFEVADRDRASLRSLEAVARGARTIYDNFVQRYSETLQQNFPVIEARVISPALPPLKKSSPKTLIVLGGALVAGVLLGLTTAFVRDSLDRGFRTPAQVEAILGANCLGLLPMTESGEAPLQLKLSAKHGGERRAETCPRAMRKVLEDPFSRFSETVRGVKVAMDLLNLTRPAQLVGVTSSIPGEGKSTFSANLAALAAQTGASTLLIDLDLRNPSLTRSLGPPRDRGRSRGLGGCALAARCGAGGRSVRHARSTCGGEEPDRPHP